MNGEERVELFFNDSDDGDREVMISCLTLLKTVRIRLRVLIRDLRVLFGGRIRIKGGDAVYLQNRHNCVGRRLTCIGVSLVDCVEVGSSDKGRLGLTISQQKEAITLAH